MGLDGGFLGLETETLDPRETISRKEELDYAAWIEGLAREAVAATLSGRAAVPPTPPLALKNAFRLFTFGGEARGGVFGFEKLRV